MRLENLGIILYDGMRAKAYLQNLINNNLMPSYALLIEKGDLKEQEKKSKNLVSLLNSQFDVNEPLRKTLQKGNIQYNSVLSADCNSKQVTDSISKRKEKFFIYSGGGILKKPVFETGKKFIHIHPGIIPGYRGSTCFYYSYIEEEKCGATAFIMNEGIDFGEIIAQKEYPKKQVKELGPLFDVSMRADLLVQIMKDYADYGKFKTTVQNAEEGETYFVIHPVLEHLAILMCEKNNQ